MPKDPPTKIKVTEMSRILRADDNSVFLIVQNGVGHKISFSDLKKSIISELMNQLNSTDDKLENLSKTYSYDISSLSTIVDDRFNRYHSNLSAAFNQHAININQRNSLELSQYIKNEKKKLEELRQEINDKKLQKAISKNSELSKKLELFKEDVSNKLTDISKNIDKKYNDLVEKITPLSEKYNSLLNDVDKIIVKFNQEQSVANLNILGLYNQLSTDISSFKLQTQNTCKDLSTYFNEFDIKLYGLTINDVDLNSNHVITEHVKIGDIQMLSSQLQSLEEKLNNK